MSAGIQTFVSHTVLYEGFSFTFKLFCRLFLFTVLLPFWCTVCHWLRLIMKIIYCVSGFPSICYMTWGVCATINLFTVACSLFCFQEWFGDAGVEKQNTGLWNTKKRNKKTNKKITFSFVSLNVYASVFIERTIVFKTVSERCLCHSSFSSWIFNRHHSCRGSTCTKDHIFPPWELWLLLLCPKLFYLLFFFKGGILNYFHVKFFFTFSGCCQLFILYPKNFPQQPVLFVYLSTFCWFSHRTIRTLSAECVINRYTSHSHVIKPPQLRFFINCISWPNNPLSPNSSKFVVLQLPWNFSDGLVNSAYAHNTVLHMPVAECMVCETAVPRPP